MVGSLATPRARVARVHSSVRRTGGLFIRHLLVLVLSMMLGLGLPSVARAQSTEEAPPGFWSSVFWTYTAGFDFSRGDYGLDRSSTLYYVPLGVIADYDRFRVRVVLPILFSDGPSTVRITGGADDAPLESDTNSGFGEIVTSASYLFDPLVDGLPYIEAGLQVTAPTRSKNELGTGGFSFATRIDLFQQLGPVTPFAAFGRTYYTVGSLDDRFFASIGVSAILSERVSAGVAYDWLEETSSETPDAHEIAPFLSFAASDRWSLGPYGVFGLSDGSPDYGVGLTVSFAP